MRKQDDSEQVFIPGYDGRKLSREEIALRNVHDPLWLGYVSEFMKNPELLNEQDNIDRLLKDINDFLHLVWNKKNFPKDCLSEQSMLAAYDPNQPLIPQMSFVSNHILDNLLAGNNKFEALRQIFLDKDFCQLYEKFVVENIWAPPTFLDTVDTFMNENYNFAVHNNDSICLFMFVQTLGSMSLVLDHLETPEDKDQFKKNIRKEFNKALQELRAIGDDQDHHRGKVADTFEEIWQNFTITQFDPPTKAAGLQGGNR